jgi:hypothetical protein
MKRRRIILSLSMLLVASAAYSAEPPAEAPPATSAQPAGAQAIQGTLLKLEGSQYVIRDSFGKEVRLKVNASTKIEGGPKVGDAVEIKVMEGGVASSITKR